MKFSKFIKNNIVTVICYLFILLFVYAAVSKLLDLENFQVQIRQSSLLSVFGNWVSWGVIILEIIIAILLCFQNTRLLGLFMSLFLMIMFTAYIVIILNFSPYVPCSCGGVLEVLGWKEHLVFNVFIIGMALLGIFKQKKQKHGFN